MTNLQSAIKEAKEFAATEGGKWCVVERLDPEGGVFEYATAPVGVTLDDNESIVWSMYDCECGELKGVIGAVSPEKAAEVFVTNRAKSYDWFANQNPFAASVVVDGVEYLPAAFVPANAKYVWGA